MFCTCVSTCSVRTRAAGVWALLLLKLQMERQTTKGRGWYNMPLAEMTEEKKNDLMVIQMRKALDPKRFYKGPDIRGALPKYVQV